MSDGDAGQGALTGLAGFLYNACMHDGSCFTTPSERELLNSGDYASYYKEACSTGDTYACQAGEIANGKTLPAILTTARLMDYAADNGMSLTQNDMDAIRLGLATGYANYLGDSPFNAKIPSATTIAEIHWDVFSKYSIPPRAFGGTPLGTLTPGGTWYTKQYPFFIGGGTGWCPDCAK